MVRCLLFHSRMLGKTVFLFWPGNLHHCQLVYLVAHTSFRPQPSQPVASKALPYICYLIVNWSTHIVKHPQSVKGPVPTKTLFSNPFVMRMSFVTSSINYLAIIVQDYAAPIHKWTIFTPWTLLTSIHPTYSWLRCLSCLQRLWLETVTLRDCLSQWI